MQGLGRRAVIQQVLGLSILGPLSACSGGDESRVGTKPPAVTKVVGKMPYRRFGGTDLEISEVGFGSWGIGGQAYGAAARQESLRALSIAEEQGCNFIDTAMVYGEAEPIIGEFLESRRDRWVVATKYSGQPAGVRATLEEQLRRLRTDRVDLYLIHWAPKDKERHLYDELRQVREAGKARYIGVSLRTTADIDYVIENAQLDGVMLPLSLLDPLPFLARESRIRASGLGVIARSSLKEGFLTGKFTRETTFTDPNDQRSKWPRERIVETVEKVEQLRFLEGEQGSLLAAAVRYPLTFPEVSTVVLGTMTAEQSRGNFGDIPGGRLSAEAIERVSRLQLEMGLWGVRERVMRSVRSLFG